MGGIFMKLKQICNIKGLSLQELSELSRIFQITIKDLEQLDDEQTSSLIKLADVFGGTG